MNMARFVKKQRINEDSTYLPNYHFQQPCYSKQNLSIKYSFDVKMTLKIVINY